MHFLRRTFSRANLTDLVQIPIRVYSLQSRTITDLKKAIREEMRAIPRSLCEDVMDSFVLRVKKCTELNGGHLEHMLYSTQKHAGRHHVLALY